MTTFGTSAYLKLLALNPQPRDTELSKRIWSTGGSGGYDFHKAMREIATEFAGGIVDWPTTRARLRAIKQTAERQSATAAAFALMRWVNGRPIRLIRGADEKALSPNQVFSVKFAPDFEIDINGVPMRVHIWNTKSPPLRDREAIGTLGLFITESAPNSLAVLSLRTHELFVPSDTETSRRLAHTLALDIEQRFNRISAETRTTARRSPPAERRIGRQF